MYNYKQYGLDVLTSALNEFERTQTNISSEAMDKIWDITLRTSVNNKIKRIFGRCYYNQKLIELFPARFDNNLLAYKDTILHELAHHITNILYNEAAAHGPEWRSMCKVLGCEPSSTKDLNEFNIRWRECKNIGYYKQYLI